MTNAVQPPHTHAVPDGQPQSVHQIADRLFAAYRLDGGRVHLAGCSLDDRLFVRLDYEAEGEPGLMFLDQQGREVAGELIASLGLACSAALEKAPPQATAQWAQFVASTLPTIQERFPLDGRLELVSVTALWCKHASGKLRFTFGQHSVDLGFAGWVRTLEPPPYVCPYTAATTFHLAETDDGRIVAAEQIARCEESGRRVLLAELVDCQATGKRVRGELTKVCPASGQRLLARLMGRCRMCGQQVAPVALRRGRCRACRHLNRIAASDHRVARLIDQHPGLARWRWWHAAETTEAIVLVASGWVRRLLLVVDKGSQALRVVARGRRTSARWSLVAPDQFGAALRDS